MSDTPTDTTGSGAALAGAGLDGVAVAVPPAAAEPRSAEVLALASRAEAPPRVSTEWLRQDIVAGLVLTAVLVPVGMAYAEAAGLPPITGLYATMVPLTAYAIFGPSRILVLGPDSSLAGIIAAVVLPLAAGDPARAIALAGMLSIFTGLICVAAGLLKFGFITDLLSKPMRYGYVNGIALTVIVGQLPKLFGFSIDATGLIAEARAFVDGVRDGQTNGTALLIGVASLAVILGCKRWLPKVPGVLVAVVGATVAVGVFDLAERADLSVVGVLPQGLPPFEFPAVVGLRHRPARGRGGRHRDRRLCRYERALAHLCPAGRLRGGPQSGTGRAGRGQCRLGALPGLRDQQQFVADPGGGGGGREDAGDGAGGGGGDRRAAGRVPRPGQESALGRARGGRDRRGDQPDGDSPASARSTTCAGRSSCCRSSASSASRWSASFPGSSSPWAWRSSAFIQRAWRPYDAVLGRVDGQKGYHDVSRHPEARRIPGLVLFRWDAPLFFANAEIFQDHVKRAIRESPTPVRWVVVAAEPITDVDTTAADRVKELLDDLAGAGIRLCFAEMKGPVKDQLKRYGLFAEIGPDHFFPTIGAAVAATSRRPAWSGSIGRTSQVNVRPLTKNGSRAWRVVKSAPARIGTRSIRTSLDGATTLER